MRFLSEIVSAVLGVTLFYFVSRLVTGGRFASSDEYFGYAIIGLAMLEVSQRPSSCFPCRCARSSSPVLRAELVSPLGAVRPTRYVRLPVPERRCDGADHDLGRRDRLRHADQWSTAILSVPWRCSGSLAFLPFAVLITAAVFVFKQAGAGAGFLITCLSLVAGVFFPVALLPTGSSGHPRYSRSLRRSTSCAI